MKHLLKNLAPLFVFAALFLLFYVWRFTSFRQTLRNYQQVHAPDYREPVFPRLGPAEIVMLGWGHSTDNHPQSSYLYFTPEKPAGVVRIGIFGCSFVAGSEAAFGHDFPSLLQEEFARAGYRQVEVINFGVASFGMHQAYLLWQCLGRRYDLDYTVFMPLSFHEARDRSFIFNESAFGPVHARYVLAGDALKLIPVAGRTRVEASEIYFGYVPRWAYLRYDGKMPPALRALLPAALRERTNPLYYKPPRFNHDEMPRIYNLLFQQLADSSRHTIVLINDEPFEELMRAGRSERAYFLKSRVNDHTNSFLCKAPGSHFSAAGNRIRAEELFALLAGHVQAKFPAVQVSFAAPAAPSPTEGRLPLYDYDSLAVCLGANSVASLVTHQPQAPDWRYEAALAVKRDSIASLLLLSDAEPRLLPLPFLLREGDSLQMSFSQNGKQQRLAIGVASCPAPVWGRVQWLPAVFNADRLAGSRQWVITLNAAAIPEALRARAQPGEAHNFALILGNRVIANVERYDDRLISSVPAASQAHFSVIPARAAYAFLRARAGQDVDAETLLAREGSLDLALWQRDGTTRRCALGRYCITADTMAAFSPVYPNPIARPAER